MLEIMDWSGPFMHLCAGLSSLLLITAAGRQEPHVV